MSPNGTSLLTPWFATPGRFQADKSPNYVGFIALLVILCAIVILRCIVVRRERVKRKNRPRVLYRTLCKRHRLSWRQRRLLKRVGRKAKVGHPVDLFLNPNWLLVARELPEYRKHRTRITSLLNRLFQPIAFGAHQS